MNVWCKQSAGSYFHSDDMGGLLESHFEDLSAGPTADLPLTDQVCHLCWIPLWTGKGTERNKSLDYATFGFTG